MKSFEKLVQRKVLNVFCAATETLVQGTNDANKMGQAFGFRQAGVLSPHLFAVYLDDLSTELTNISRALYW